MASFRQIRRLLEFIKDNFLRPVIDSPSKEHAVLESLFTNTSELLSVSWFFVGIPRHNIMQCTVNVFSFSSLLLFSSSKPISLSFPYLLPLPVFPGVWTPESLRPLVKETRLNCDIVTSGLNTAWAVVIMKYSLSVPYPPRGKIRILHFGKAIIFQLFKELVNNLPGELSSRTSEQSRAGTFLWKFP